MAEEKNTIRQQALAKVSHAVGKTLSTEEGKRSLAETITSPDLMANCLDSYANPSALFQIMIIISVTFVTEMISARHA